MPRSRARRRGGHEQQRRARLRARRTSLTLPSRFRWRRSPCAGRASRCDVATRSRAEHIPHAGRSESGRPKAPARLLLVVCAEVLRATLGERSLGMLRFGVAEPQLR